ncbi:MAG: hypothetical protein ACKOFP_01470, partial [Actinomycetota bacterium]
GGIDVGTKLTPYVRHRGHEHFIRGKATVIVQQDGTFTWSRASGMTSRRWRLATAWADACGRRS